MTPHQISAEDAIALLPDWPSLRAIFEMRPDTGQSVGGFFERKEVVKLLKRSPAVYRSGPTGIRLRLGVYIQTVHPQFGFGQLFIQTEEPDAEEPLMVQYAIYDHPKDAPDSWVVREWWIMENEREPLPALARAFNTLEEARDYLPEGLTKIARHPDDDVSLVEAWV